MHIVHPCDMCIYARMYIMHVSILCSMYKCIICTCAYFSTVAYMRRVQSFFSDKANQRDHISQMPSYIITSLRIRPIISVDTVGPVGRRGA